MFSGMSMLPNAIPGGCGTGLLLLAIAGCGSSLPESSPRVQVMSGGNLSDTVQAAISGLLALKLPSGHGGAEITFTPRLDPVRRTEAGMWLCPAPGQCGAGEASIAATDDGRANMVIAFGTVAGPAWIDIISSDGSIRDSVPYHVLPGTAAAVRLRNTIGVAYVGGTLDVGPSAVDRYGNLVPGAVTMTALNDLVSVSSDGTLTANAFGRGGAVYAVGTARDTVYLTVVPQGVLASIQDSGITLEGLDGIVVGRRRVEHQYLPIDQGPIWLPGGNLLVGDGDHLDVLDSAGHSRPYAASGTHYPFLPTAARQNGAIVMAAYDLVTSITPAIYWIDSIGDTPKTLPVYAGLTEAGVSPDGIQIAVVVGGVIKIADLRTGTFLRTLTAGAHPRWSPDGTMIGFLASDGVVVIPATGGSVIKFSATAGDLTWSPDSQWLLTAYPAYQSMLLNPITGMTITLPSWTATYLSPAWEP
jgi:hypothetical protein